VFSNSDLVLVGNEVLLFPDGGVGGVLALIPLLLGAGMFQASPGEGSLQPMYLES
jgi:hypothetical protein